MKALVALLAAVFGAAVAQPADAQPAGDVSTIVMNAVSGRAAVGMTVELYEVSGDTQRRITQAVTGDDGRVSLIPTGPLPLGSYELRCTQFCGTNHYQMKGQLTVETPEEFQAWLKSSKAAAF